MQTTLDTLWRQKSGVVLATLIRLLRDVDVAEDAMQGAFEAAAKDWPHKGMPANPVAWLISAGKFRAIDRMRRNKRLTEFSAELALLGNTSTEDAPQPLDLLALMFTCCHPALPPDGQVALTLRSLCGLTTEAIAAAFLQPTPTMAQRIFRAKALIKSRAIPFEVPGDTTARLGPVLAVIYLVFNEGYGAHSGESLLRADLSALAISLARDLHNSLPDPEVKGLLALMLFGAARGRARVTPAGEVVLLSDQDRALWDHAQIAEGQALLDAAFASKTIGPYTLQAAIAALHVTAPNAAQTDWPQILALYTLLMQLAPSPIVALNRAVAYAAVKGPAAALDLIAPLIAGPLAAYAPAHAARGELLAQLGRHNASCAALQMAMDLTQQPKQRRHLQNRMAEIQAATASK